MSFFNSVQQFVTSSVANLNLSPKRFSFSRESGNTGPAQTPGTSGTGNDVTPVVTGRSGSTGSAVLQTPSVATSGGVVIGCAAPVSCAGAVGGSGQPHYGVPKVVPPPLQKPLSVKRRSFESPVSPRRLSTFRQPTLVREPSQRREKQAKTPVRPPLMFCRRRQSWPEVDQQSRSGVQETDGSFFESFTALSWKQENRRLMALQEMDQRAEEPPPTETSVGIKPNEYRISKKETEQLYVEVLYTIANKVGASKGQYAHYKEDLFSYAQEAFGIHHEQHRKFLAIASEEKPPIVVLNVVVIEAEGLEAKDANGFSDPYCMLGIQPGNMSPASPQYQQKDTPPGSPRNPSRTPSDGGTEGEEKSQSPRGFDSSPKHDTTHEKLRKHHSFRLSFKRKDHGYSRERREHRDSLSAAVPAKFIRATTVKPHTLNPKWNEKFRFDIDDVTSDIIHLDIWDHDDESSVFDAVSKLNEVRGVKGLGRFFKQIAQSARSGSQDDFLGCVNVPMQDIPSTGLDCWYKLEARTQRSNIQGRIRLKLWLSTREDRGLSEEDNWSEIRQQERLHVLFIGHEVSRFKGPSWQWSGELPHVAQTILHQHAIQGDVTNLQLAVVRWIAYCMKSMESPFDYRILYRMLQELDQEWGMEMLSREEEESLADSFNMFIDHSLHLLRKHRQLFPPSNRISMCKLEFLLRCLGLLSSMKAFWKCCPFNKEIRGEITGAVKKGTLEWYVKNYVRYEEIHQQHQSEAATADVVLQGLTHLITLLLVDLRKALESYNGLFESTNGVPYFSAVFKQLEKMLAEDSMKAVEKAEVHADFGPKIEEMCAKIRIAGAEDEIQLADGAEIGTPIFELYLAMQEFVNFKVHLPPQDRKGLIINNFYEWYTPAISRWLDVSRYKAMHRIHKAAELNKICQGDLIVKHSTSAVDVTACFYQIKEFWKQLAWPDLVGSYIFITKIVDNISNAALYYADLTLQKFKDSAYYEDAGCFKVSDEMCVTVNDLEYVRRSLVLLSDELQFEAVLESIEQTGENGAKHCRASLYGALDSTTNELENRILLVIARVGQKMKPALKKDMFHLAWSPDSLPTSEAITPLMEYLDVHLVELNAALLNRNFERVLSNIWEVVLTELREQTEAGAGDKVAVFYERLYEALEILFDFFHAEEKGLSIAALQTPLYIKVEQLLQYHKTETERLVDLYYIERLEDQLRVESTEYGVLSVRAYFNHDSLCVEVLNARDVIPLDPNGFSDPFVIIELLPRRVFSHCAEQHTNVQKKTLNPMFDECFEFSVTLEQCRSEGAMVLFTVMDHDVLTFNDFAGEAFLSLSSIPGVDGNISIDNFHGLKHVDLILMHQKTKNHPILHILESRTGDKLAQDFYKKQKERIVS